MKKPSFREEVVKIRFEMSMRIQHPEELNELDALRKRWGKVVNFDEPVSIWLQRQVEWTSVPRDAEDVWISDTIKPRMVIEVAWDIRGVALVWLSDFNPDMTSEEVEDEYEALKKLLDEGWEIDVLRIDDSRNWIARGRLLAEE